MSLGHPKSIVPRRGTERRPTRVDRVKPILTNIVEGADRERA